MAKVTVHKKNYSSKNDRPSPIGRYNGYSGKGIYTIDGFSGKFYVRAGSGHAYFATPISRVSSKVKKNLKQKGKLK